jgi:hypothetical protein
MTQSPRKTERSSQGKSISSPDKSAKPGKNQSNEAEMRELEDADLSQIAGGVRSNGPITN